MADGQDRICEGSARRLRSLAANFPYTGGRNRFRVIDS
jgi:hypothetical protein